MVSGHPPAGESWRSAETVTGGGYAVLRRPGAEPGSHFGIGNPIRTLVRHALWVCPDHTTWPMIFIRFESSFKRASTG